MKKADIREYIHTVFSVENPDILNALSDAARLVNVKRNTVLFAQGEKQESVYILTKGVLQAYFLDADGKNVVDSFYWGDGMLVVGNFDLKKPANINIATLNDCRMISIPLYLIGDLIETEPEMLRLYTKRLIMALEYRMCEKSVCHYSAPIKRLKWMERTFPEWEGSIPDKYIASFLRMTPVTLSRLRRRIREGSINLDELDDLSDEENFDFEE